MLTFKDFAKKYNDFHVPQYEILIGSPKNSESSLKPLNASEYPVLSISVNQSIEASSSAQITFLSSFNYENSDFEKDYYGAFEIGSKIAIKLGYGVPATVFVGAIGSVSTNFSPSGITVGVTCYDAKITLFYNTAWKSFTEKSTVDNVVKELLKPCEKYGNVSISFAEPKELPERSWVQDNIDDYHFLMQIASLTNSSFYTSGDTVYFVKNVFNEFCEKSGSDADFALGWGAGLMSLSVDIDVSGQIGSVEIAFRDKSSETGHTKYEGDDIKGKGSLPDDKGDIAKRKAHEKTETLVDTEKQALAVAKNIFMKSAINYVKGRGQVIGIPDITVGKSVELTGLGKKLNGIYFIGQAAHQFDGGGFITSFTCHRPKI